MKSGPWTPLSHPLFRAMWIASVASNIGTWMHTVAAGWLMTTLALSPLLVALVQTATTLPTCLLALPAGALADTVNRRHWLIFSQTWLLLAAAALGVLSLMGVIGPWWLLGLTFALGIGSGFNGPAWAAAIPELVSREELAAAVALNAVSFNIARAIGPALGGLMMAATSAGVVFLVNAASFLGVIVVLWVWRYEKPVREEPDAALHHAMRDGLRYIRDTSAYHAVLIRVGFFAFAGSALWALLPVVASAGLAMTSLGYGILLGCLGSGCIVAASGLTKLRSMYPVDRLVAVGNVAFAFATIALVTMHRFAPVAGAMVVGGMAWMLTMANFNVTAQMAPPARMRARALAVYLMVFQGVTALGSGFWGALADRIGVNGALIGSTIMLLAGLAIAPRLPLAQEEQEVVSVG